VSSSVYFFVRTFFLCCVFVFSFILIAEEMAGEEVETRLSAKAAPNIVCFVISHSLSLFLPCKVPAEESPSPNVFRCFYAVSRSKYVLGCRSLLALPPGGLLSSFPCIVDFFFFVFGFYDFEITLFLAVGRLDASLVRFGSLQITLFKTRSMPIFLGTLLPIGFLMNLDLFLFFQSFFSGG